MARATVKQRAYITKLAESLDDVDFKEVMDATSRVDTVQIKKGKKPVKKTKAQRIAGLDSKTASEVIELLKTPAFVQSIMLLSGKQKVE